MGPTELAIVANKLAERHDDAWAVQYITWHKARCADDVLRISLAYPGARILNVGGAPYLFEAMAKAAGLQVTSVDLAPERHADVVSEIGIAAIKADFENRRERMAIDLASYDVICLCEVLEHMRHDLIDLLSDLAQRARKGAVIYLTTPNFYYPPRLIRMLRQGRSGPPLVTEWRKLSDLGHMGHVREYSRTELVELFEFCGLRTSQVHGRNSQSMPWYWYPLCKTFAGLAREFVFILEKAERHRE